MRKSKIERASWRGPRGPLKDPGVGPGAWSLVGSMERSLSPKLGFYSTFSTKSGYKILCKFLLFADFLFFTCVNI